MHAAHLIAEIRTLAPDASGWAQHEKTGRACAVCPCGLNTGFVSLGQAAEAYRSHVTSGQNIRIVMGGGGEATLSLFRHMMRKR